METKTKTTIMQRLEGGYEAACKELKRVPLKLEKFKLLYQDEDEARAFYSLHRITTFIKALKEGHKFDYNKYDEEKHFPVFDMETYEDAPAGSGFSLFVVVYAYTHSYVGPRLSSMSDEHVRFVVKIMEADYKIWMKE